MAETWRVGHEGPLYFGAVSNGDLTESLTNFIDAVKASPSKTGVFRAGIHNSSAELPKIDQSGIKLLGVGPSDNHDVGALYTGTVFRRITNSGGKILEVAPTEGNTAQRVDAVTIDGIAFDCNGLANTGLSAKSVRRYNFNIAGFNATEACLDLNVIDNLGEGASLQTGKINFAGRQVEAPSGLAIRLNGTSSNNPSCAFFESVDIVHSDAPAIKVLNADNNIWEFIRTNCCGSANNSIEWHGGSSEPVSARWERINHITGNRPAIVRATGYTYPATNIVFNYIDKANGTPDPIAEAGSVIHGVLLPYTPTVTGSGGGTPTTITSNCSYVRRGKEVDFFGVVNLVNIGSLTGRLRIGLPFTADVDAWVGAYEKAVNGQQLQGNIVAGNNYVELIYPNTATMLASGLTIVVSGKYIAQAS